jgi:uncharacterized protein YbjQ (UPF0145 family)
MSVEMMMSTTFDLPGFTVVRQMGLTWGVLVRSVGFARGISGSFKALAAGEVSEYTDVVNQARTTAVERLIIHAQQLGANAVLGLRFDSSDVGNGLTEILAYGTAVVVAPQQN